MLGGVICLKYGDDTTLFSESNIVFARNLKWVLTCFEQVSGMRINYSKSELIPVGLEEEDIPRFLDIFGCAIANYLSSI